jgi:hypothetical protein
MLPLGGSARRSGKPKAGVTGWARQHTDSRTMAASVAGVRTRAGATSGSSASCRSRTWARSSASSCPTFPRSSRRRNRRRRSGTGVRATAPSVRTRALGFGPGQRQLSPQDVNEVVRQILPVIPQIVNLLQGQQSPYASAIYGTGIGWNAQGNQQGWGQGGNPNIFGQQSPFGPLGQAAFGNAGGGYGQQRQLNPQEVGEIVRHLTAALPQVIANLQAINQQQQRAA